MTMYFFKKTQNIIFLSLIIVFFTTSCSDSNSSNQSILFTSGGRTSEILVVINNDLWNSAIGDSIKASFQITPPWSARIEPEYIISHIPIKAFGSTYQKQRNILFIKKVVDGKEKVEIRRNVYAKPQSLIVIKANDIESLTKSFVKYQNKIKSVFHKNELKRISNAYRGLEEKKLGAQLGQKFGFKVVLPKGFEMASNKADFAWLRRVTKDVEEGIIIYTIPYNDTASFNMQNIINLRNSLTKFYIPGPINDTYMKVSNIFPPYSTQTDFKGHYSMELRSLWDVKGYAMGGPFMSYTFVDSLASRLITIDGYIKAPKKEKRDLMLHVEAILNSFEYVELKKDTVK